MVIMAFRNHTAKVNHAIRCVAGKSAISSNKRTTGGRVYAKATEQAANELMTR